MNFICFRKQQLQLAKINHLINSSQLQLRIAKINEDQTTSRKVLFVVLSRTFSALAVPVKYREEYTVIGVSVLHFWCPVPVE